MTHPSDDLAKALELVDADVRHHHRNDSTDAAMIRSHAIIAVRKALALHASAGKLELRYHSAIPNFVKIIGLDIRPVHECEGGGFMVRKDQAEIIMAAMTTTPKDAPSTRGTTPPTSLAPGREERWHTENIADVLKWLLDNNAPDRIRVAFKAILSPKPAAVMEGDDHSGGRLASPKQQDAAQAPLIGSQARDRE